MIMTLKEIKKHNEELFNVLEAFFFDCDRRDYTDEEYFEALEEIEVFKSGLNAYHYDVVEYGTTKDNERVRLVHESADFRIVTNFPETEYMFIVTDTNFGDDYVAFFYKHNLKFKDSRSLVSFDDLFLEEREQ